MAQEASTREQVHSLRICHSPLTLRRRLIECDNRGCSVEPGLRTIFGNEAFIWLFPGARPYVRELSQGSQGCLFSPHPFPNMHIYSLLSAAPSSPQTLSSSLRVSCAYEMALTARIPCSYCREALHTASCVPAEGCRTRTEDWQCIVRRGVVGTLIL